MNLTMRNLEECFKGAKENNATYMAVGVKHDDSESAELIINPNVNFDDKLEYYKKAYTNNLILKNCDKIKITGFTYGNTLADIEIDLFEDSEEE
ncbi:UNVERIFIED_ORG: hypothetical protein B2H93_16850 [Clostridium botulinum]